MELNLEFLDNSDFNAEETYICYDASIKLLFISKMMFYNGSWVTIYGLGYKANTIKVQRCSELYDKVVTLKGIDYKGVICRALPPNKTGRTSCFGVLWDSGKQVKDFGLCGYWTDVEKINLNY